MAIESFISLRRFAGFGLIFLLFIVCLCSAAAAQTTPPLVTSSFVTKTMDNSEYQSIWNIARSSTGDVLVMDFQSGLAYQIPADGRPLITLGTLGGWANPGIAVDPWNNLYLGNDWNGGLSRIPYDPVGKTWQWSAKASWGGDSVSAIDGGPGWFHPAAISVNASGYFVFGIENPSNTIFAITIDENGNYATSQSQQIATGLAGRPKTLAVDNVGNIYFLEDGGSAVYRIPAGTTGITGESSLTRVDQAGWNPTGVAVDPDGNVYISDSKKGVYVVPNESGTPNNSHTYLLTSLAAQASVAIDATNRVLFVPIQRPSTADPNLTVFDVDKVTFTKDLGTALVGGQGGTVNVNYAFSGDVTPANIACTQNGVPVVQVAGNCSTDPNHTYHLGDSCTATISLSPHTLGPVSCNLEMQDAQNNVLASSQVQGVGELTAIVSSFATVVQNHPSDWGQVWETAVSSHGDVLVKDFEKGGLYQFPGDGRAMITLVAPGAGDIGTGWNNMGVTVDPWDNLYVGTNWSGQFVRFPYDPVAKTWNMAAGTQWGGNINNIWWYQPATIAVNATGLFAIAKQNENTIFVAQADSTGATGDGTIVVTGLKGRPRSLAIDNVGNIYFFEDGGAPGVLRIPAGSAGLSKETTLTRVDPNLGNIGGVSVDSAGNVYITDNNLGVFMVPNENGTPNSSNAVTLTAVPAFANVLLDSKRGLLYVPTKPGSWGGWNGFNDLAKVTLGTADLGSATVGTPGATAALYYSFSGDVTPASFGFVEAGASPDFTTVGGSCAAGTTYHAQGNCTLTLALNPKSAGGVAGQLQMLDSESRVLASTLLHGVGQGSAISVTPALESAIGTGLQTPTQVATDAFGNAYVADAGLGKVLQYPKGSNATTTPVAVGTGFTAPTGVAVDGAGDVFIADSGSVVKVPYEQSGLNATDQVVIKSGLGSNLKLAVDGAGTIFVADPDSHRVVKIVNPGTLLGALSQIEIDLAGFTQPSAMAVDGTGNLFVIDGSNLIEVAADGSQTTLLTTLGGANGVALDPSGAMYVSQAGGAVRIPNVSGTLDPAGQVKVGATVIDPTGLALDKAGNLYLTDGLAQNLHLVSANGILDLGSPALGAVGTGDAALLNIGNSPLTITGFGGGLSGNSVFDFAAAGNGCDIATPVASGASCAITATFNPGPGEEGPLSSQITVESDAANSPVVLNVSGVGADLAKSKSVVTVASSANANDVPVTVTVSPLTGAGVPTGDVTLKVDGQNPVTATMANGSAQFHLKPITAGSHTFSAVYNGDRTYGRSTASATATVGKGAATIALPDNIPTYVLSNANVPNTPVSTPYFYTLRVQVKAAGTPTGMVAFMEGSDNACGEPVSVDPNGYASFDTSCLLNNPDNTVSHPLTPHTITAVYQGDDNYTGLTSAPVTFQLLRNPSVVITSAPPAVSVAAGSTVSANLTLTSLLGYGVIQPDATQVYNYYTLPLQLDCTNLPARATCTFEYPQPSGVTTPATSVTVTEQVPGTAKVTIHTNVSAGTVTAAKRTSASWAFGSMFVLGLVGLVLGGKTKRGSRVLMMICTAVLIIGIVAGMVGCANSSSTNTAHPQLNTPAGTYAVTVTARQVGHMEYVLADGKTYKVNGSQNQMSLPFTINVTVQ